jgi:integrase
MPAIIKKRLQVQTRGASIDRSLIFVVGTFPEGERRKLRGVVFGMGSKVEALRMYQDLHAVAKAAVADGGVAEFLDSLDERARTTFDPGPRFREFAKTWYEMVKDGLREATVISDRQPLDNHLDEVFGTKYLRDIGPRDIDRYKAAKRQEKHQYGTGYSPKTINNHLAVIHRIFEKGIEYGLVEKNPVTKKSWMRPDRTAEEVRAWWTPDEEAKAMSVLVSSWRSQSTLKYLTLATQIVIGLRFSELRALEKRDLELQAPGLWIRRSVSRTKVSTPKNRRARFHVIPRDLAEELRRFMLTTDGQLLFADPRGVDKLLTRS